jgi:hypothetical protein
MAELDDIEKTIIQAASDIARQCSERQFSDRLWTQTLIAELGSLGSKLRYHVCGQGCAAYGQGEWLYDMVWLEIKDSALVDIQLILESEWGNEIDIREDFLKLLVGRAQHRVMVFQNASVEPVFSRLIKDVQAFQRTENGDRYLLIGRDLATRKMKFELFVA